ncbi:MAG TPA: hypothetical protein PLB10_18705, partial [Thiolinea sp.]|nr:hypothetical protein [Thiolinea sp.]
TATPTNLGNTVDTTNPNAPVVNITNSNGDGTSFTIPIPEGSVDGVVTGVSLSSGNTLTLTRSNGLPPLTVDLSALMGGTATPTNLGNTVDTTNPNAPVVNITNSNGDGTSFTIPIPAGSAPSITNLGNSISGTNVTITSSDGDNTVVNMTPVINSFFSSLPNCT